MFRAGLFGFRDECRCLFTWEISARSTWVHANYAISATVVGIANLFYQKNVSSRSPGLNCSYGKNFIPNTEISVAKSEISVTAGGSPASHLKKFIYFFRRKERRGEISEIEPAQSTGLT